MTRHKVDFDESEAEQLWLDGKTDPEASEIMGVSLGIYGAWRRSMGYPDNIGLFRWQTELGKRGIEKVPEKYRRMG